MTLVATLLVLWGVLALVAWDHINGPSRVGRGGIPNWGWEIIEASVGIVPTVILYVLVIA